MAAEGLLKDWEIIVQRDDVEKLAIGMTDNPFADDISTTFGFSFTNSALGGCGKATVNLMAWSESYLASLDIEPDDLLLIRLQYDDEASLVERYLGVIHKVPLPYGTNPKEKALSCVGIFGEFNKIPLFAFYDDSSIATIVQSVIGDLAGRSHIGSSTTLITYGSDYTIAETDFFNLFADKAIKRLAELAGPDCVWGVIPGASGTPFDARFYFEQLSDTATDPGFEVGVNIEDASGESTRENSINGMLVTPQRKLAGGDLWMYIPPPEDTIPHRIQIERVPELVDPTDAYAWSVAKLASIPSIEKQIRFKVPGYGKQIWTDERINTRLAVTLQTGGSAHEVFVRGQTVTVGEDGSVDTEFELGTLPALNLYQHIGNLWRDVIVSEAREFWSGAELAARDSDVIRTWRRHAAQTHDIMNFWGTNLDNIESVMSYDDWNDGGYDEPTTFPDYGWEYNSEKQRIAGSDALGTVASIPIPTGLTAGAAIVYIKTAGATYWQADTEHWSTVMSVAPDVDWLWLSDWFGIRPHLYSLPTNAWAGAVTCMHSFVSGVPEIPMKVWIGPLEPFENDDNPTTYGGMKTLSNYIDIVFASSTNAASCNGYCLRLHRRDSDTAGNVACALGWVNNGTFHSDWWDAGATSDSQTVGTICLGTDASGVTGTHSFELDVWLPTSGGSGTFRVRARKDRTAEVLWDSSSIHGDGEVSGSAPNPAGRYYVTMVYLEATPENSDKYTCGLKNVDIQSPGGINVAVTRDGEFWTVGESQVLLTLFGDEYLDNAKQLMFAVNLGEGNSLGSWGVGFTHQTPSVELEWDQNFGDSGSGDGYFAQPRDLTMDSDYIYVSDYGNDRIQLLTNTDPPVFAAKFGTSGSGNDNFDHPFGIDQDDTYLYIADSSNDRIKVHLKASPYTFIREFGSAYLSAPSGVTVVGRTYDADDLIYVSDAGDEKVHIFKKDGTYVDEFEPFSDIDGAQLEDVTVSGDGKYLYCVSSGNNTAQSPSNCIRKVKATSPYDTVWTWGERGQNPDQGSWEYPWAICRLGDLLFVTAGSNAVTPQRNYLVTLADRGGYCEYLDHEDGSGGETGSGFLQPMGSDIKDNVVCFCEVGYSQIKRYLAS